jgi:hypothetical protein
MLIEEALNVVYLRETLLDNKEDTIINNINSNL